MQKGSRKPTPPTAPDGWSAIGSWPETGFEEIGVRIVLSSTFPPTGLLPRKLLSKQSERSRPAADATREVRERWLPNG
jgi:hypothetical protein